MSFFQDLGPEHLELLLQLPPLGLHLGKCVSYPLPKPWDQVGRVW